MSDSAAHAPPLHSALGLDPHRPMGPNGAAGGQPPPFAQSHAGLPLGPVNGLQSLQSLQSLNHLGIGVGYAMPMHMAPFRPLYMPTPDVAPLGVDPALGAAGKPAKAGKSPAVGKRMKVSRACDECRRKKTRCDIDSENDVCSLCRRANVMCTFARQQLKRGPARKRSSQPLPLTGSASPPAGARPARSRSQSASEAGRRDKESPVLPPIETLLSYQKAFAGDAQTAPIPIPTQRRPSAAYSGHDAHASPPLIDFQPALAPVPAPASAAAVSAAPASTPPAVAPAVAQAAVPTAVPPSQEPANGLSGFPVLVEVACSQSQEAPEKPLSASAPSALALGAKTSPSSMDSAYGLAGKAPTPPNYYDGGLHGVMHQALMEYYTFCHPVFPILPNSIAEFDAVFQDAGPVRQCLVAAINAGLSGSIDLSTVPFGLSGSHAGGADREAHLMALLLVYINTLEYTWLGAAVAECAALNAEPLSPRTERLTTLVAVLDRLNGIIFGTRSLFPADLQPVAMRYAPVVPTLIALLTPEASSAATSHFRTAPEIALATLGQLGSPHSATPELLLTLETLAPQVQRTPLEKFVQAALARHRSGSEDMQA